MFVFPNTGSLRVIGPNGLFSTRFVPHCMLTPSFFPLPICYLLCRDLVCPFTNRINIDPRKSPKLSRAAQEVSRSPRLPIRKPSIGSPSLTRREFPLDDITQVLATFESHDPFFKDDRF